MAIINNDPDEVDRILRRFPDSIAELDLYKRSPLHLASTRPEILGRLLELADFSILKQRDGTGANALDMAMALSSRHCVNGREYVRCRECSCYLCAKYLLNATYNLIRTLPLQEWDIYPPVLSQLLEDSSELARRHYIFHLGKIRSLLRPVHALTNKNLSTKQEDGKKRTASDKQGSYLRSQGQLQICDEADGAAGSLSDWIFQQIRSVNLAQLFYRHGFMISI
ncbi:hypothetical protein CCUS01_02021 [Colletotrichum cuscutae]|uniref:Ankyrin repeat protein n=1 Tax=Colletotrichum cuscutae TaxID=1209917 RepID=A0AAI9U9S0_9PEZI|nr:hypothetical protein CCUS01_02021 [Colletotrichum cuscutae]